MRSELVTIKQSEAVPGSGAEAAISIGGWRDHLVMLGCATVGFSNLYVTQSIGPELRTIYGLTMQQCGALLTATMLGLAIASPFVGRLIQRIGLRRALVAGLAALGLLNLLLAAADTFPALLVLRGAQGMCMPMVLSALLTSIQRYSRSNTALGISATYVMGTICGGVLGRILPASLVPEFGWSSAFLVMAALQGAALTLAAVGFKEHSARTDTATEVAQRRQGSPALYALYAGGFAVLFSQLAVSTYIAFRLAAPPFAWQAGALGLLYLVFLPALVFVRSSRRIVTRFGHMRATVLAAGVAWCGLFATLTDVPALVVAGLAVFSVSVFFVQAVFAHALSVSPASSQAQASGGYLFFYYLGGSLGAIAPALIWPNFGWPGCLGLVATLQLALAVVVRSHTRLRGSSAAVGKRL